MTYMNECLECKYKGNDAIWNILLISAIAPMVKAKTYHVKQDSFDKEFFDLNIIDAKKIAKEINMTEEQVEDFILNGYPTCPKCKSSNYFKIE